MSDNITKRVGLGTAYGFAKAGGYEGTVAEFTELLGNIAIDLARIENLSVTVTTLPAGSQATASLNGSVLSLGIPKGDKGDKGNTGNTPDFGIGTVTTLSAGSSATASITGTAENPVLNLGIPQGEAGAGAAGVTASAYSSSSTYAVGDYVIHNSNLYRCTTAITTAEAFTAAHWTQVVLADDVSDLKSDLNESVDSITDKMMLVKPTNLIDQSNLEDGFITANGTVGGVGENTYYHYVLPVTAGETISFWAVYDSGTVSSIDIRFICAYDSDSNAVEAKGSNSNNHTFTIQSGITSLSVSFARSLAAYRLLLVKGTDTPTEYSPYFEPYYKATSNFLPEYVSGGKGFYRKESNGSTGVDINIPKMNIAKNVLISFYALVNGSGFTTSINIGQGGSADAYDTFVSIAPTGIVYNINGSTLSYDHGLTIDKYIHITITGDENTKAKILIESNGGEYSRTLGFYGFSDSNYYAYSADTCFSDCVLTVSCRDLIDAKSYVFGDSYTAIIESTSKWTHWAVDAGYGDSFFLNAFPGENGAQSLSALQNVLAIGKPKFLVWCVGMNDGADTDSTTPNSAWLDRVSKVLGICQQNGIVPILATIPTVPSILNEGKNKWVRESTYRYIDFAKAVGAQSDGTWFTGMLSTDNVHPSELGAKALWHRVLCDFPEITM